MLGDANETRSSELDMATSWVCSEAATNELERPFSQSFTVPDIRECTFEILPLISHGRLITVKRPNALNGRE